MPKSTSLAEKYNSMLGSLQRLKTLDWDIMDEVEDHEGLNYHKWEEDNEFLERMAETIFSCNLDWEDVKPKWPTIKKAFSNFDINKVAQDDFNRIKETPGIIPNERKIKAIIRNANQMKEVIREYGTFANYLCFYPFDLKEDLLERFDYLGRESDRKVVLDFMKEMGFPVIKDDKHIRRVLFRLGLINSEDVEQDEVLKVGKEIADAVGKEMAVLDTVLWWFGKRVCKDGDKRDCKKCLVSRCDFHL
jgi:DNA-3-methyladenine glycosylase I